MSLKLQFIHGVSWTTLSKGTLASVSILQIIILARFLDHEDFGLFATVSVILGLAAFFVEAGLGSAIIHKQDADPVQLGTARWINLCLGFVVFLVVFSSAWAVASFYDEPRLKSLIQLSSIIFLVQPFAILPNALLQKGFCFKELALVDIAGVLAGFCLAVWFALNGYGVLALIFSQIFSTITRTLLLIIFELRRFGAHWRFSLEESKFYLRFGGFQIGENTVNYFNTQVDVILIGKILGQEALGLYYLAKQLVFRPVGIINPVITQVAMPAFAKIQGEEVRLKRAFLQMVHTLATVHFAVYLLLACFSNEIVAIFLGEKWEGTAVLVSILSFYVLQRAIGNPVGSLLMAKGRVDLGFYWNLAVLFYTPLVVWVGVSWGLEGVAWGLVLGTIVLQPSGWYFLIRPLSGASFAEYFGPIMRIAGLAALSFGVLFFLENVIVKVALACAGTLLYLWWNRSILEAAMPRRVK